MSADEILALLELLLLGPECDVSLFHHLDLRFTDKPSETGRDIEKKSDVCCDLVLSTRILHRVIKAGTILESVKNHQRRDQKQPSKEQPQQPSATLCVDVETKWSRVLLGCSSALPLKPHEDAACSFLTDP